ncbi:TVP38/TMEM64 family protein [Paracoccus sp. JM45]|uniref:TVP38/TMEM64 family protein n=1 Tax=Paracoccus sp. JM45 TaxID=2283626 RepID=UPI000E6C3983|nr:VTT domain-containing protein [Paracoccus sp. JM45]RJE79378.1 TVP38/TMEM64 family protein [Paracoccus sp. JM45]
MPAMLLRIALIGGWIIGMLAIAFWLWPSLPALQSDLTVLHENLQHGQGWRDRNPELAILSFVAVFTVAGALPIPAVVAMTLAGGAFFGFWTGLILSLAGTVLAAVVSFLMGRHLLADLVRRYLGRRIDQLDRMVDRDGALALLSLRLTPALPFFVLNTMSGLSKMSLRLFVVVTTLGVLPNKIILSGAGTQLAEVQDVSDIFGPRLIAAIAALAAFPWIARWLSRRIRQRTAVRTEQAR